MLAFVLPCWQHRGVWDKLGRLKARKLWQWALAYAGVAWLLLQLFDILGDQFAWPDTLRRSLTVLLGMGFFAALVLAWYHGEKGRQRVSGLEITLLAIILLATAGIIVSFNRSTTEAAVADRLPERAAERGSLAVLPFVDMSAGKDQEYFSDGMTEELLNALAQVDELRVAARTSSFAFKGKDDDVRRIAAQLDVASIVEGSVRAAGDRVRVTAQLIDGRTGKHIWSQTYDRKLTDILALQEDIARSITAALRIELDSDFAERRLVRSETPSAEAYDLYLRGRYFWNQRTPEGLQRARKYFEQAVAEDSSYAAAWAGLADVYVSMFDYQIMASDSARGASRAAAERAVSLDPQSPEAHNSLAHVHLHDWRWADAEREFRRAIELDPNYASAYHWYSLSLTALGRLGEAVAMVKEAYKLDRLSTRISADVGMALYAARAYDEAIEQERRTLEMNPELATAYWIMGMAQEQKGAFTDAIASYQQALQRRPASINFRAALASAYARAGNRGEAERLLAHMEQQSKGDPTAAFFLALVYTALGRTDDAFSALNVALQQRSGSIRYLKVEPRLDPLRADVRFKELLRKAGLPT